MIHKPEEYAPGFEIDWSEIIAIKIQLGGESLKQNIMIYCHRLTHKTLSSINQPYKRNELEVSRNKYVEEFLGGIWKRKTIFLWCHFDIWKGHKIVYHQCSPTVMYYMWYYHSTSKEISHFYCLFKMCLTVL